MEDVLKIVFFQQPESCLRSREEYICHLLLKLFRQGRRIHCHVDADDQADYWDERLWSCPENEFLPHQKLPQDVRLMAVSIGDAQLLDHQVDLTINLTTQPLAKLTQSHSYLEVVGQTGEDKQLRRKLYQQYQQAGHTLQHKVYPL